MTDRPMRVAMLSVHTSPLDQPGTGDAGGMNVYVVELSRALARRGVAVEVFTRATSSELPAAVHMSEGVTVRHIEAGPFRSEEHTSELQSRGHLVCRLLLEKKKKN